MDINKIPIKPRCTWITGMGSAGKNNHCNKAATHRNRFGWDYYYCKDHTQRMKATEDNAVTIEPISAFRRFIERARQILSTIIAEEGK